MTVPARIHALAEEWSAWQRGVMPDHDALPLHFFKDIDGTDEPADFVEGLLGRGGASVLVGPPNVGKSFFALDLALSVALGRSWFGRATEQGAVLYVALEGGGAAKKRLLAFKAAHGIAADAAVPFALVPASVALQDGQKDVQRVVEAARTIERATGLPVVLIVVDTLARAMAGGDENSAEAMGGLIRAVDAIRSETGAHVMAVHHTGKNKDSGARGHSSLLGAIDTEITIAKDGETSTVTVTKQRDFEGGQKWAFKLETVELGTDRRGNAITSCVVRPAARGLPDPRTLLNGSPKAKAAYEILVEMVKERDVDSVTEGEWRKRLTVKGVTSGVTSNERSQFRRILAKLSEIRVITEFDGDYWPRRDTRDAP